MSGFFRAVEELAKYLGANPTAVGVLLIPPLVIMYYRFKYHQDVLKSPGGLAGVLERLALHGWRSAYFGRLRRALTWVDCQLGQSAWSADSYEFTLSMAFIYPFASLLIVWVATGQNTSGIFDALREQAPLWQRAFSVTSICACAYFQYRFNIGSGWRSVGNLLIGAAFIILSASAGTAEIVFAIAGALAVAGARIMVLCVAVPFGVAIAAAVGDAVAVEGARFATGFFVYFVVCAVGVAIQIIEGMMARRGLKGPFYIFFLPVMLAFLALIISNPGWFKLKDGFVPFIFVFLVS